MPLFIAGATILAAGGSALASSSAANKAARASQAATDSSSAVQNRALDLQQSNTAQARSTGDWALTELEGRFGRKPQGATGGGSPALSGGGAGAAATGGFNPSAYLAANPDLQQYYQANAGNRDFIKRFPTPEAFAAEHYQTSGQQEIASGQRAPLPGSTPAPTQAAFDPSVPQAPEPNPPLIERGVVDDQGSYVPQRPTVAAAPVYETPDYRETDPGKLDVSLGSYEQSPDYEFQLSEGNRNILANASATGGLESGAALKALQKFGQNLAMGDYGQWRDYTTGQYNTTRNFTANRDDAANAFNSGQAQNRFNAANSTYQFGNTLSQNMYNSDRDYASGRYDTRTNNLLSLAGLGQGAVTQSNNAIGANASALSNGYFGNAQNQGNAALASAGQTSNAISNGVNALAYYYGNKPTSTGDSMKGLY